MGRRPNPQRKQDLLEEIVTYLGEHGIGDMSLRPLAKRLGTSTYTLTYQFGSKDQLLADAVDFAQARQLGVIGQWAAESPAPSAAELLRRYWDWAGREPNLRIIRMLIEATTLGHSQPEIFGEVGQRAVQQWIKALSEALRRDRAPESNVQRIATQAYATLVGLQVDLIATNDRPRVDKAFEELCSWIEAEAKVAVAAQ
jgi:AcrR family transcriptional regulator